MRILQLNSFHAKVGGAEVYYHLLAEGLCGRGNRVAVFGGSPEEERDEDELFVVRRPDFDASKLVRDPELAEALRGFAARFRPDVVHVHNLYNFAADFVSALGRLGVPVVQTVHEWGQLCPNAWCVLPDGTVCEGGPGTRCMQHGCESNYPYDGRVLTASMLRYRLIPRTFDAFLCPSQALADDLARHGYPHVEALPLWVDVEGFGQVDPEHEPEPGRVLFMGRLVREKGVEYLVRAMAPLRRAVPEAHLSVVGGGPEQEALETLAQELGLADAVTFHGKVPHDEVREHFARAAVNVLPSIWCENSPVTCYESYIAGTPMVASRIAGLPAMVVEEETGLLATPRDPEDLARAIGRVLTDGELRRRLSRGCRDALARYSRDRHLDRVEAVYDEVLARRAAGDAPEAAGGDASLAGALATDDVLDVLHRANVEHCKVEEWALGMKKHIDWLESREGNVLPPALESGLKRGMLGLMRRFGGRRSPDA